MSHRNSTPSSGRIEDEIWAQSGQINDETGDAGGDECQNGQNTQGSEIFE